MRKSIALCSTLAIILLEASIGSSEIYFQKGSPRVKLTPDSVASGAVKFSRNGRPFSAFIGIPYATVPERFAEPQQITAPEWKGVKEFVTSGTMCSQLSLDPTNQLNEGEDCLNLNIYVPMNNTDSTKGYPILFWIHGGSFHVGNGLGYGPSFFMDEDVILITINYRLGIFGFLSTGDEVIPGNNGLKDQVAALKWVKQNIGKFGGDTGLVTAFGESAGSAAVQYLMLSPTADGLFHRAISQSGSTLSPWAYQPNPKENAVAIATQLNCSDVSSSKEILHCLKSVTKLQLNIAQFSYLPLWPKGMPAMAFLPTAEPEVSSTSTHVPFLTKSPFELLTDVDENGDTSAPPVKVPWMVGVTEDEGATMWAGWLLADEKAVQELDSKWSDYILQVILSDKFFPDKEEQKVVSDKLRKFYFGDKAVSVKTADSLVDLVSDGILLNGVYRSVSEIVSRGKNKQPVYLYQYSYHGPLTMGRLFFPLRDEEAKKVGHTEEIQHQFDVDDNIFPGTKGSIKEDTPDAEFSRNFVRLWTSFAKYGEPKHSWGSFSSEKWSPVTKCDMKNLPWYRIDSNPKTLNRDPYKDRMEFWNELWQDHFLAKGRRQQQ